MNCNYTHSKEITASEKTRKATGRREVVKKNLDIYGQV